VIVRVKLATGGGNYESVDVNGSSGMMVGKKIHQHQCLS